MYRLRIRNPGLNDIGSLFTANTWLSLAAVICVGHDVKNRVSFSHIDPKLGYAVYDYFPAINFFDVASHENDEIVGLVRFEIVTYLLPVFHMGFIWKTTYDYELVKSIHQRAV